MIRQKVDYGKYRYSQKEILKYIGESAALCGAVDYLFYQTPWVMLLVVPVSVFFLKWKKKQMIMSLMPAGIILYLQLASPGFLDILYGNPFGICAMTVCLTVYGAAYWMGKRIVEIEV